VLHDFAAADRDWLEPLLRALARAAPRLAAGDPSDFMNRVALEARPAPAAAKPAARKPEPAPAAKENAPSSPFARLAEHFRRR